MKQEYYNLVLDPAIWILLVLDRARGARDTQWVEGVHHNSQLLGAGLANAALRRAGVRPMRQAARMQRDAALLNASARHEIALDIIEHLVAVHIRVVVGRRDG